ncbi:MAG: BRO family protein, partial [Pelagimonas sp.]|nr:BRO family protein [Pelagimonas sp.]
MTDMQQHTNQAQHLRPELAGLVDSDLRTTSRIIAEKFGKRHDNVQRDIRKLMADNPEWGSLNFEETPYVDPQNSQTYQMYKMTRDGYSMLIMGFTGKAAMEWKIKFLEAFNTMERICREAVPDPRNMTHLEFIEMLRQSELEAIALRAENNAQLERAPATDLVAQGQQAHFNFDFKGHEVRTTVINGEPWFVAADVCKALGVANPRDAVKRLDDDEKDDVGLTDAIGREQSTTIINESGLYSLILSSRKPEAKPFKKWVTSEVLPTIRKTGSYGAPAQLSGPELMAAALIEANATMTAQAGQHIQNNSQPNPNPSHHTKGQGGVGRQGLAQNLRPPPFARTAPAARRGGGRGGGRGGPGR